MWTYAEERARLRRISGAAALAEIAALRPRDADYVLLEVGGECRDQLARHAPAQCLVAAAAAGPLLLRALIDRLGDGGVAAELCPLLAGPFPPERPLCRLDPTWRAHLRPLALGVPGEPVEHGLFPSRATKLARLLLAAAGEFPVDAVLRAAAGAFARGRPYHAHDAVACALVCGGAPARQILRAHLADTRARRGWRSRQKTHALARWAAAAGYMTEETA